MKKKTGIRSIGCLISFVVLWMIFPLNFLAAEGNIATFYVSSNGSGDGSIGNPANLQSALDTARTNGMDDILYLSQGTYDASATGANTFEYGTAGNDTMAVTLSGGWSSDYETQSNDPSLTILDGGGNAPVLYLFADQTGVAYDFTLSNITIQNGKAINIDGAGIRAYTGTTDASGTLNLVIHNSVFNNNNATTTYSGGAIYSNCYFEIYDTHFNNNTARNGGALFILDVPNGDKSLAPIIDHCTFDSNNNIGGWQGSNIFNNVSAIVTSSTFTRASGTGSPIYNNTDSYMAIKNSIFYANTAQYYGSAVQYWAAGGNITNCLFYDNEAGYTTNNGYAAVTYYSDKKTPGTDTITLLNSAFWGNRAQGTFAGAIHNRGAVFAIANSIFWNNEGVAGIHSSHGSIVNSIVQNNAFSFLTNGGNNLNIDPMFVNTAGTSGTWDFNLTDSSPAIDSGADNAIGLPATDIENKKRKADGNNDGTIIVDMGAYEYGSSFIYGVTPGVVGGGTISPANEQAAEEGSTQIFTLTPDDHYSIGSVEGTCGGSLTGNVYTTGIITGNCKVIATFIPDTYIISAAIDANGSLDKSSATADYNTTASFTITSAQNHTINPLVGGTCPAGSWNGQTYTTGAITEDCSLSFEHLANHIVTPSAGIHGSVSPSTAQTVTDKESIAFTITPDAGYTAIMDSACGGILLGDTYTIDEITSDCNVIAHFVPISAFDQKLLADDGAAFDNFSYSVAIAGDLLIIGAPYFEYGGIQDTGAVYIFTKDIHHTWNLVQTISSPVSKYGYNFGLEVAVFGDLIAVSNGYNPDVDLYQRNQSGIDNWEKIATIQTPDNADFGDYGGIALDGDTLAVGAFGAAYIFQKDYGGTSNWGQVKEIIPAQIIANAGFGSDVDIAGDILIVGATGDTGNTTTSGAAYIFQRNQGGIDNWGQVKKIFADDGDENDGFGLAVAASADTVVSGAARNGENGSAAGAAYVFAKDQGGTDNWGQVKKLTAFDKKEQHHFGQDVAVMDDMVAISNLPQNITQDRGNGAVYLFAKDQGGMNNWGLIDKMTAQDGEAQDSFGHSVSMDNTTLLVGAFYDSDNGTGSGSAYLFPISLPAISISMESTHTALPENAGPATVLLNLSEAAAHDVVVYLNFSGTAFPELAVPSSRIVVIPAGELSGDISIMPVNDTIYNADKVITVEFLAVTGALDLTGQKVSISIVEDEKAPSINDSLTAILPPVVMENDIFGSPVATSDSTLAVGAPGVYGNLTYPGRVYLYRNNGSLLKTVTSSDGYAGDLFGTSIALEKQTLAVGASSDDDNGDRSGSVYIFEKNQGGSNNWGQVKKILSEDGVAYDDFGYSVALSGDILCAGAIGEEDENAFVSNSGAVYVYYRNKSGANNWGQVKKLMPPTPDTGDFFGGTIAISGETLAVGAYYDDDQGENAGAIYIYNKNQGGADNWGLIQKITAPDGKDYDAFGRSLALSGTTLIAGVTGGFNFTGPGKVYVFETSSSSNTWEMKQKLVAYDGQEGDSFGSSVAIAGNTLIVGASQGALMDGIGMAYIFQKDSQWNIFQKLVVTKDPSVTPPPVERKTIQKLISNQGTEALYFGISSAIDGQTIVVGARGKAYMVTPDKGDINGDGNVDIEDVIGALKILTRKGDSALAAADVNEDGKIGIVDAIYILIQAAAQ
ncbi:MAG: choice-of-anchor Q domain-containing protein [Pseudomonadota bacterium]